MGTETERKTHFFGYRGGLEDSFVINNVSKFATFAVVLEQLLKTAHFSIVSYITALLDRVQSNFLHRKQYFISKVSNKAVPWLR